MANDDVCVEDVVNYGVVITFMIVSHTLYFKMELMLVKMTCIGEY